MDTSKKYYEDKIRDFNKYRRGRTLAQFCFLKPVFSTIRKRHTTIPSQLLLFLTGAVQTKLDIE